LKIESIARAPGAVTIRFIAAAGRSYSILYRQGLATGPWQKLADVDAPLVAAPVEVNDASGGGTTRFYRLVTPKLP
jgi:hypothetical protein